MKCPSCGYENRENAPYCDICQTPFSNSQTDSPVATSSLASQTPPPDVPDDLPEGFSLLQRHTD